jgi:hypothetical protein
MAAPMPFSEDAGLVLLALFAVLVVAPALAFLGLHLLQRRNRRREAGRGPGGGDAT